MSTNSRRSRLVVAVFLILAIAAITAAAIPMYRGWSLGLLAPASENTASTAAPSDGEPPQGITAPTPDQPLVGAVTVAGSTGADGSYATLKDAFDAINLNGAQAGNAIAISIE